MRIALALLLVAPQGKPDVDNPEYQAWAAFEPGARVTLETEAAARGKTIQTRVLYVLRQILPDRVTIDTTMQTKGGAEWIDADVKRQRIAAKVPAGSRWNDSLTAKAEGDE